MEGHRGDGLMTVFTESGHSGCHEVRGFLPVVHHDVLIEGDLVRRQDLLLPTSLLLLVMEGGLSVSLVGGVALVIRGIVLMVVALVGATPTAKVDGVGYRFHLSFVLRENITISFS